ncbi:MAG: hypothetical protein ACKVOM_00320 [Ferruginibacter sp.]
MAFLLLVFIAAGALAQDANKTITAKEVLLIETVPAAADMRGRKQGTPEIEKSS